MAHDLLHFEPDTSEAQELFAKRCTTVEEKYRILEARDKLLRARVPKVKVRVELAVRLFGTCPDMCPEKERYMRQYQRQLTNFEMQPVQEYLVNHQKAIKAYSRSSADQEEPLPHELRPGSTLEMTMDYLLHNIVPIAEDSEEILGDWYNFLWDRTRSIRKDITQQQLTDLQVVGLMEKCARFHIHCASRLCELDLHQFEPKLNDENLMKCLQSLEQLYNDLRRRDIKCPNEPEFRAYQIMMNLNEGDILWDVQQRPEWILKSWEVQAAISVHHSIFSKNFVVFFRLVKSFPYMFSCILHRYFFQVRCAALHAFLKSSPVKKSETQISFSTVQRVLGYGEDEVEEFRCLYEAHGMTGDMENDRLLITRRRFMMPESRVVTREINLIESKQTASIAEAINGGPLASNPALTYRPQNSFDEQGYLIPGPICGNRPTSRGLDQLPLPFNPAFTHHSHNRFGEYRRSTPSPVFGARPSSKPPNEETLASNPPPAYHPHTSFHEYGHLMSKSVRVVEPSPQEIMMKKLQSVDRLCNEAVETLLTNLVNKELKNSIGDAFQRAETERRMQERLRQKEQIRTDLSIRAADMIVVRDLPHLLAEIINEEFQRHCLIQRLCESYANHLLSIMVKAELPPICASVLMQKHKEREILMAKLTRIFNRLKMRSFLYKWMENAKAQRLRRELEEERRLQVMLNFPAANPVFKSTEENLMKLRGNYQSSNISKAKISTPNLLDKYERVESMAENYRSKVRDYVVEMHRKSLGSVSDDECNGIKDGLNEDYYRHCWKRRWSSVGSEDEFDSRSNFRGIKSPRQEPLEMSSQHNLLPIKFTEPTPKPKPEVDSLLDEIRRFTEDARKEKENFAMSTTMTVEDSSMADNTDDNYAKK